MAPSSSPSWVPSSIPSQLPSSTPSSSPTEYYGLSTFYAIGDVPYSSVQASELAVHMANIPDDADFVVHVGDLRHAGDNLQCVKSDYTSVSAIFQLSHAPVFVILGDNDWNDCPNPNQGLRMWNNEFLHFESRHWNHTFDIVRQDGRPDNFSFVHKGTLFLGLNLVGGRVLDATEWATRLADQASWTIGRIHDYAQNQMLQGRTGRVVIFGHANPTNDHLSFFHPLRIFIRDTLQNELPILYINGDKHEWLYEPSFFNQPSFLRIMLTGGSSEPPLKVVVHADGDNHLTNETFTYDRRLSWGLYET